MDDANEDHISSGSKLILQVSVGSASMAMRQPTDRASTRALLSPLNAPPCLPLVVDQEGFFVFGLQMGRKASPETIHRTNVWSFSNRISGGIYQQNLMMKINVKVQN